MRNNHPFFSRFVQIAGFAPEVYQQCSTDQRYKMVMITFKLLFTSLTSALIVSVALNYTIFHSPLAAVASFFLFFGVNYCFDRMIIAGQSNALTFFLRILAILTIPLLHTLLFDTYIFRADLEKKYNAKVDTIITGLENEHQLKDFNQIDALKEIEADTRSLNDTISLLKKSLAGEVDGTLGSKKTGRGGVFETKEQLYAIIIQHCEEQIVVNARKMEKIDSLRIQAQQKLELQKATIEKWENVGLLGRISLLHECTRENKWVFYFSLLWWIFFVLLEALPMLGKGISKTNEYDEYQAQLSKELIRGFSEKLKQQSELTSVQMEVEFLEHKEKLHQSIKINLFQAQVNEIRALYHEEMNALIQLVEEQEKTQRLVVEEYSSYVSAAKLRAIKRLENWIAEELKFAA